VLWVKATEDDVKRNYEKDAMPEPWRYFVKEYIPRLHYDVPGAGGNCAHV
jgi:hypothetical protein